MKRQGYRLYLFLVALVITAASSLFAQEVLDPASVLHPPAGAKVALVVFEDLQCPDCARANPLLKEAVRTYEIPLVRYDFPLPRHVWAMQAAVFARYFDTHSNTLGDEFRDQVLQHQSEINKDNLRQFAERFASEHKVELLAAVDPEGKLQAAAEADRQLGRKLGVSHTPTIYVVTNKRTGTPFVEVVDRSQLFQMIEAMKQEAE